MQVVFVFVVVMASVYCKVYDRCELARELKTQHKLPEEQIATWVCIARHESEYNTSAVGHLNWDGSGDHGLFQISDLYWCSPPGVGWACGVACDQLEDDDIKDDVACVRRIHRQHQRLAGDGFTAWAVYRQHCSADQVAEYVEGCFDAQTEEAGDNNEVVNSEDKKEEHVNENKDNKGVVRVKEEGGTKKGIEGVKDVMVKDVEDVLFKTVDNTFDRDMEVIAKPLYEEVKKVEKNQEEPEKTRTSVKPFNRYYAKLYEFVNI